MLLTPSASIRCRPRIPRDPRPQVVVQLGIPVDRPIRRRTGLIDCREVGDHAERGVRGHRGGEAVRAIRRIAQVGAVGGLFTATRGMKIWNVCVMTARVIGDRRILRGANGARRVRLGEDGQQAITPRNTARLSLGR